MLPAVLDSFIKEFEDKVKSFLGLFNYSEESITFFLGAPLVFTHVKFLREGERMQLETFSLSGKSGTLDVPEGKIYYTIKTFGKGLGAIYMVSVRTIQKLEAYGSSIAYDMKKVTYKVSTEARYTIYLRIDPRNGLLSGTFLYHVLFANGLRYDAPFDSIEKTLKGVAIASAEATEEGWLKKVDVLMNALRRVLLTWSR